MLGKDIKGFLVPYLNFLPCWQRILTKCFKAMDNYIREMEGQFPNKDTIYEYYVDVKQKTWILWEEKLRQGWRYNPSAPFYKIIVPTVDTVRYEFITENLIKGGTFLRFFTP